MIYTNNRSVITSSVVTIPFWRITYQLQVTSLPRIESRRFLAERVSGMDRVTLTTSLVGEYQTNCNAVKMTIRDFNVG